MNFVFNNKITMKGIFILGVFINFILEVTAYTYTFNINKYGPNLNIEFSCIMEKNTEKALELEVNKYKNFLDGNKYNEHHFVCEHKKYKSICYSKFNNTLTCETGYEGEFCNHYGGTDNIISCK